MDPHPSFHDIASRLRRCGAFIAAMLVALSTAACNSEREAVPDPQKPPLPKTSQYR